MVRLGWTQSGQELALTLSKGCPLHTILFHTCFCGMQLIGPLHHYLNIAQGAQTLKQAFSGLLHSLPVGIGIEGHQSVGQGAATAQGDTQVMDRIGTEIGGNAIALLQDPQHPIAQAGGFRGTRCANS